MHVFIHLLIFLLLFPFVKRSSSENAAKQGLFFLLSRCLGIRNEPKGRCKSTHQQRLRGCGRVCFKNKILWYQKRWGWAQRTEGWSYACARLVLGGDEGLDWEGLLRLLVRQGGFFRLLCFVLVFFEMGTRDGELKVVCWMKGQSDSSNHWFQPVCSGFRETST